MRKLTMNTPVLWYENAEGAKWFIPVDRDPLNPAPPPGFVYQVSRFPLELLLWRCRPMTIADAIVRAATACERCVNVLAHDYGLPWGYARDSYEHRRSNTACEQCSVTRKEQP